VRLADTEVMGARWAHTLSGVAWPTRSRSRARPTVIPPMWSSVRTSPAHDAAYPSTAMGSRTSPCRCRRSSARS